jgi:hypothetical protein
MEFDKEKVVISRYWHKPEVEIGIGYQGIQLAISLDDFRKAVFEEMGSVAMTFTKAQLQNQLEKAFTSAIAKVKVESEKAWAV